VLPLKGGRHTSPKLTIRIGGGAVRLQRNPDLSRDLVDGIVGLWMTVTEAGGAVGFVAPVTEPQVRAVAETMLAGVRAGGSDVVVARRDDDVVGLAFLQVGPRELSAHVGVVRKLMRHPGLGGAGVGARVLTAVEDAARDRDLGLLTLTVRGGTGRQAYYAARGYQVDAHLPARLRVAGGRLVEEIVMSKALTDEVRAALTPLQVHRLDPDLPLPGYAHPGDAGLDLRAATAVELAPGERASVPTGLAVAVPPGCVGLVHPRSGLAARHGLAIVNAPGTIDSGYRGEVRVLLVNLDPSETVRLARGDRIAQLLVQRVETVEVVEVDALDDTPRGEGGFGSTGR